MGGLPDNLDSTLTHYRLYCVGGAGKIVSAHDIFVPDDEAALEGAKEFCHEYKIELWQGARRVGEVEKAAA